MQANSKHMSSKSTRLDLTKKFIQGLSANNSKKANMIHVSCMYIYNNLDVIIILYFLFCWLFPYQTSNMQTWILKPCQAQPSSPLDPHRFWVDRNAPSASDQGALKIENLHLVNLYSSNQVTWKLLLAVYKVYIYIYTESSKISSYLVLVVWVILINMTQITCHSKWNCTCWSYQGLNEKRRETWHQRAQLRSSPKLSSRTKQWRVKTRCFYVFLVFTHFFW